MPGDAQKILQKSCPLLAGNFALRGRNPNMKIRQLALRLALAAILATGSSLANEPASSYPPVPFGALRIEKGMSRAQVRDVFGEPTVLAPNVWAFFKLRFLTTPSAARCDAMVVRFEQNRASEIRLCESEPLRALIARLERNKATAANVSAK